MEKKTKRKIGIDVDEVLAELMKELNTFYNNSYRTNFKFEDYKSYKLEETWGVAKEKADKIVNDFFYSEYYKQVRPIPGSQRGVAFLSNKNELSIITSRPICLREDTYKWVNNHFPKIFSEFHFTGERVKNNKGTRKADICRELGVDILIEDCLEKSIDCASNGTKIFLFDRPWNQYNNLPKKITRISGWEEVIDILR